MGKKKRIISIILILPWMLIMMGQIGIRGHAEQIRIDYNISMLRPYLYGSRYQCAYTVLEDGSENVLWSGWNAPEIWNLLCEDRENGAGSLPAYMLNAEPVALIEEVSTYRKESLNGPKEEKIGAVLRQSFPYLSLQELEQAVNDCFGPGSVKNLTAGEAISASQQAIWKIQYGERFIEQEHYVSIRGMGEYVPEQFAYPESLLDSLEQEGTSGNIECLYRYYLSLSSGGNSEIKFSQIDCDVTAQNDGSWAAYVSLQIEGIEKSEEMNLTFSCGDVSKTVAVTEPAVSFFVGGLEQPEPVTLVLDAVQNEMKPYQFMPEGEGPALIACEEQKLHVFIQKQVGQVQAGPENGVDTVFSVHTEREPGGLLIRMVPQFLMFGGTLLIFAGAMVGLQCFQKRNKD